jgi:hypothetical protein
MYVNISIYVSLGFWEIQCLTGAPSVIAYLNVRVIIIYLDSFCTVYCEKDNSGVRVVSVKRKRFRILS